MAHMVWIDATLQALLDARCLMEDFVEDPATGSANGDLAGYVIKHGYFGAKNVTYTVHQGEDMGRPSVLHIHAAESNGEWTIEVGGKVYVMATARLIDLEQDGSIESYIVASGEWE